MLSQCDNISTNAIYTYELWSFTSHVYKNNPYLDDPCTSKPPNVPTSPSSFRAAVPENKTLLVPFSSAVLHREIWSAPGNRNRYPPTRSPPRVCEQLTSLGLAPPTNNEYNVTNKTKNRGLEYLLVLLISKLHIRTRIIDTTISSNIWKACMKMSQTQQVWLSSPHPPCIIGLHAPPTQQNMWSQKHINIWSYGKWHKKYGCGGSEHKKLARISMRKNKL